jgi:vacuolar-type H+-ATPase subunit D/Vma8
LTSKNKELIIELENRENRLKALRDMNMILENKGNKLVKKFSEIMKTYQDEKVKTITEKEQLNTIQKSEKKN